MRHMIGSEYELLKGYQSKLVTIGFGSYGQVKLARHLKTAEVVAVKIVHKMDLNEVNMHQELQHPHIIRMLGYHCNEEKQLINIFLQYADGGTLFESIREGKLADPRRCFREVCEAVEYLHAHGIMHRDIKPENILLKDGHAKLCDFGFAAFLSERKTLCGTNEYMSPEMICHNPYDFKIDIWALGILLFELLAAHAPFTGTRPEEVYEKMKLNLYFPEHFSPNDILVIKTILKLKPQKRPSATQIIALLSNDYFHQQPTLYNRHVKQKSQSNTFYTENGAEKQRINQHFQQENQFNKIKNKKQSFPQFSYPFGTQKTPQKVTNRVFITTPEAQISQRMQKLQIKEKQLMKEKQQCLPPSAVKLEAKYLQNFSFSGNSYSNVDESKKKLTINIPQDAQKKPVAFIVPNTPCFSTATNSSQSAIQDLRQKNKPHSFNITDVLRRFS